MSNPPVKSVGSSVQRLLNAAKNHIDAGHVEAAKPIYEQVAILAPDNPDAHHTLGLVCFELGQYDQAVKFIGRSLELNPLNDVAYRSMGDALAAIKQYPLAIRAYEKAITLNPNNSNAFLNLGNLFHELDMFAHAEQAYMRILAFTPEHKQALNNLGKLFHDTGRFDDALDCYDRCLSRHPQHAEARFNRAALLLAMGEYEQGWQAYEWRFRRQSAANVYPHHLSTPRWQGEGFQGRRLLVHCEQGMGDVLQFLRYLPLVKSRGGEVVMEVHAPLVSLIERQRVVDMVVAFNPEKPPSVFHDLHVPLLSLPALFGTRVNTVPTPIPYIRTGCAGADPWEQFIRPNRTNIGLVWAASDTNPKRNLPLDRCGSWFQNPNLHFLSLQLGSASDQIVPMQEKGSSVSMVGDRLDCFLDTARAMAYLDLMISVDTAALHLAGAMGKPLWALLPFSADWRWSHGENGSSVWYPHARIYRQSEPGQWHDVITSVAKGLADLALR